MARIEPFAVGTEELHIFGDVDVLVKRVGRKPPHWMLESLVPQDGKLVEVRGILQKAKRGRREWDVLLEGGGVHAFKTRRQALEFFSRLRPLSQTDSESITAMGDTA